MHYKNILERIYRVNNEMKIFFKLEILIKYYPYNIENKQYSVFLKNKLSDNNLTKYFGCYFKKIL